ncbi:MAG: hypothetical protein LBU94_02830 [Clostridiales bacterium]|jgi:hypothetical protein|nr:hypothetical protein [Clostridiales bacterium]
MKSYKKLYITGTAIIIVLLAAALIYLGFQNRAPYIAVFDGEKIFLDEYTLYLVEQQRAFEQTGGADIWDTNFDGEPAIERAKRNALDSIVYVKAALKLNEENGDVTSYDTEELSATVDEYYVNLSENQKRVIGMEAVEKVMRETALIANLSDEESVSEIEGIISAGVTQRNPDVWDSVGYIE